MTPYYIPPVSADDGPNFNYGQPQQFNAQPYLQGAGGAVAGAMSGFSNQGYAPNSAGVIQGGLQGYMAGGPIGAAAGVVTNAVGQVISSHRNLNNVQTDAGPLSYDAYGRPVYQGAQMNNIVNQLPELQKAANWDSTNILGIGRKARRKIRDIKQNVAQAQTGFNQAEVAYRNRQAQLQDYANRQRTNFDNLYRFG